MSVPVQTSELSERLGQIDLSQTGSDHNIIQLTEPPKQNGNVVTPNKSSLEPKTGTTRSSSTGIPKYAIPYRRPTTNSSNPRDSQSEVSMISSNGNSDCSERPPSLGSISQSASFSSPPFSPSSCSNQLNGRNASYDENYSSMEHISLAPSGSGYNGVMSDDALNADSASENSGVCSSSSKPKIITSKVGSMTNTKYRPGGGNVKIVDRKLDFSGAQSKCQSKANLKYKPGGGDVVIMDSKLNFTEAVKPKIKSFENAKHIPGGGDVKIDCQKINFRNKATPKVESGMNIHHRPGGGDVKIFNEKLPWLKYNKPNLAAEERARINKQRTLDMTESQTSSNRS